MATRWTEEQKSVIDNRGSDLLVAAAAGSGKTAVLIERIIQLILDEKNPVDIDRLLVVTFTKAAASEMRERVGVAIEKALEKNPDNEHLQKQVMLLNRAEITTIDSFCGNIVRNNFHVTDLDPNINVADPTEIGIIASEVMEDLFEELYNEKSPDFLRLVDWYSGRNDDESLISLLLMVNNFINSSPYPDKWLDESAEFFNTADKDKDFYIKNYCEPIAKEVHMSLNVYNNVLNNFLEELKNYDDLAKFFENYCVIKEKLDDIIMSLDEFLGNGADYLSEKKWNSIIKLVDGYRNIELKSFRIGKNADESAKAYYNDIKKHISSVKDSIKIEVDKLAVKIDNIIMENDMVYPYMRSISDIVKLFRVKFAEKKKSMGVLDFADIEHYALDILTDFNEDGKAVPSKIALSYRDKYEEVFTDEYQDSNLVQEIILSQVSRFDNPNRFMVGDVKQSIYRFRQAMPEIFMDKYEKYDSHTEKKDSLHKKIMLFKNFRSRPEVLEGCNHVFMEIMRKETGELEYTEKEKLNPSAFFEELDFENAHVGGPVEIYLVDSSKSDISDDIQKDVDYSLITMTEKDGEESQEIEKIKIEAQNIANIIYKMVNNSDVDSRFMVLDKESGNYRPVEYRDIVILMRATNNRAATFEEVMREYKIPLYTEAGSGYFSSLEIYTMMNLLKIIDNPMQDIAILSVMRSPIFNFEAGEMAEIRMFDKGSSFYDALLKLYNTEFTNEEKINKLRDKVVDFVDKIRKYREKSLLMSVDEFIWYLLKDTNYYTYVGMLQLGEQRQNNLMLLFERARQYEKTSYKGLFNFINYFERIKNRSGDLGEARLISEEANVVRLMTIHKSKGLEFPIVILANTDKKFMLKSGDSNLTLHQNYGYGPKIFDLDRNLSFDSIAKKNMVNIQKKEQIAEEMRLLYVAMTRAKEKLIISGVIQDIDKKEKKWLEVPRNIDGKIESTEILLTNSYLDWIMPTIISMEDREEFYNVLGESKKCRGYKECKWYIDVEKKNNVFKENKFIVENINKADKNTNEVERINETLDDTKKLNTIKEFLDQKFNFEYKYNSSALKPSSISVSEVKKILLENDEEMHQNIYSSTRKSELSTPDFIHKGKDKIDFNSAEKGTIFHLVMQLLDFLEFDEYVRDAEEDKTVDDKIKAEVERQIELFINRKIISKEEAETVRISNVVRFIKSDIFKKILNAQKRDRVYKEKAINYSIKINELYKNENIDDTERMMLVGIIDLFFEDENGDYILLDYKTDFVNEDNFEEVVNRYKIQLELYKNAIEDISGKKISNKYIYLFGIGRLVKYD